MDNRRIGNNVMQLFPIWIRGGLGYQNSIDETCFRSTECHDHIHTSLLMRMRVSVGMDWTPEAVHLGRCRSDHIRIPMSCLLGPCVRRPRRLLLVICGGGAQSFVAC